MALLCLQKTSVRFFVVLLVLYTTCARGSPQIHHWTSAIRGGSTQEKVSDADQKAENKYRMEQLFLLQSRSVQLKEALVQRGLLKDFRSLETPDTPQPVDWDCALATDENPKSCLYSFDAEPNTKVVAPIDTAQWISLAALNRLRRTDPTKVEPMWHNKFAIHSSWFKTGSIYSFVPHLTLEGRVLSFLLDGTFLLSSVTFFAFFVVLAVLRPIYEPLLTYIATSGLLWTRWAKWARFVHAALPFKLLMAQMAWKALASFHSKVLQVVRDQLIQLECAVLEKSIPLTIVEGDMNTDTDEEEEDE